MNTQDIRISFRVTINSLHPSDHMTDGVTPKTVYEIHANSPLSEYEDRYLGTVAQYPAGGGQRWQIIDLGRDWDNGLRYNLNGDWYDTRAEAVQDLVLKGRLAML